MPVQKLNYVPGEFEEITQIFAGVILVNEWQYFVLDGYFKFELSNVQVYAGASKQLVSPELYTLSIDEKYTAIEANYTGDQLFAMIRFSSAAFEGQEFFVSGRNFGTMVDNEAVKKVVMDNAGPVVSDGTITGDGTPSDPLSIETALSGKADSDDPRLSDDRTPLEHGNDKHSENYITSVATDNTLDGDGTSENPLSVASVGSDTTLQDVLDNDGEYVIDESKIGSDLIMSFIREDVRRFAVFGDGVMAILNAVISKLGVGELDITTTLKNAGLSFFGADVDQGGIHNITVATETVMRFSSEPNADNADGDYLKTAQEQNGFPVYKKDGEEWYLFRMDINEQYHWAIHTSVLNGAGQWNNVTYRQTVEGQAPEVGDYDGLFVNGAQNQKGGIASVDSSRRALATNGRVKYADGVDPEDGATVGQIAKSEGDENALNVADGGGGWKTPEMNEQVDMGDTYLTKVRAFFAKTVEIGGGGGFNPFNTGFRFVEGSHGIYEWFNSLAEATTGWFMRFGTLGVVSTNAKIQHPDATVENQSATLGQVNEAVAKSAIHVSSQQELQDGLNNGHRVFWCTNSSAMYSMFTLEGTLTIPTLEQVYLLCDEGTLNVGWALGSDLEIVWDVEGQPDLTGSLHITRISGNWKLKIDDNLSGGGGAGNVVTIDQAQSVMIDTVSGNPTGIRNGIIFVGHANSCTFSNFNFQYESGNPTIEESVAIALKSPWRSSTKSAQEQVTLAHTLANDNDAGGAQIKNIGAGTDEGDAVNLEQLEEHTDDSRFHVGAISAANFNDWWDNNSFPMRFGRMTFGDTNQGGRLPASYGILQYTGYGVTGTGSRGFAIVTTNDSNNTRWIAHWRSTNNTWSPWQVIGDVSTDGVNIFTADQRTTRTVAQTLANDSNFASVESVRKTPVFEGEKQFLDDVTIGGGSSVAALAVERDPVPTVGGRWRLRPIMSNSLGVDGASMASIRLNLQKYDNDAWQNTAIFYFKENGTIATQTPIPVILANDDQLISVGAVKALFGEGSWTILPLGNTTITIPNGKTLEIIGAGTGGNNTQMTFQGVNGNITNHAVTDGGTPSPVSVNYNSSVFLNEQNESTYDIKITRSGNNLVLIGSQFTNRQGTYRNTTLGGVKRSSDNITIQRSQSAVSNNHIRYRLI